MNDFRILDLAGSLQRASLHRGLIRAARELAPEGVAVEPYEKLGEVPFFNQDVEDEGNPAPVRDPKEKIREERPTPSSSSPPSTTTPSPAS